MAEYVYLDTETTGLDPKKSKVVEIAIIDDEGKPIINTLVNPQIRIPKEATAIHGITNLMCSNYPTFEKLELEIAKAVRNRHVIIYNKGYDIRFMTGLIISSWNECSCCMLRAAPHFGEWNTYRRNYKWPKLGVAAERTGFKWPEHIKQHRALADTMATRHVWHWLEANESRG